MKINYKAIGSENYKHKNEILGKKSGIYYQFFAMNNKSKAKIISKLNSNLPGYCKFFKQ